MAGFGVRSRYCRRAGFRPSRILLLAACSSVVGTAANCLWPGLVSPLCADGRRRLAGLAPAETELARTSRRPVCRTTGRQRTLVVAVLRLAPWRRGVRRCARIARANCCNDHCVLACAAAGWNPVAALLCVGQFRECPHMVRLAEQSRRPGMSMSASAPRPNRFAKERTVRVLRIWTH